MRRIPYQEPGRPGKLIHTSFTRCWHDLCWGPTTPGTGQPGRRRVSTDSRRRRNPTRHPGGRRCARGCGTNQPGRHPSHARPWTPVAGPTEAWAVGEPRRHGVEAGTMPTSSTFLLLHLFYRWVSAKEKTLGRRGVARVAQEPAEPNPAGLPGYSRRAGGLPAVQPKAVEPRTLNQGAEEPEAGQGKIRRPAHRRLRSAPARRSPGYRACHGHDPHSKRLGGRVVECSPGFPDLLWRRKRGNRMRGAEAGFVPTETFFSLGSGVPADFGICGRSNPLWMSRLTPKSRGNLQSTVTPQAPVFLHSRPEHITYY